MRDPTPDYRRGEAPSGWSASPDDDFDCFAGGVPGGGVAGFAPDEAGGCDPGVAGCAAGFVAGGCDEGGDPDCGVDDGCAPGCCGVADGGAPDGDVPDGGVAEGCPPGAPLGAGVESPGGLMTSTLWMITGFNGASDLKGPKAPVGTTPIRSTTSIPSTT
jgi:hypothetical protein